MGGVGGMGGGGYGAVGGIGGTGMAGAAGQPGALGGATGAARPSSFGDRLNAIVNKAAGAGGSGFDILGQTKIIADARTNSLLVFADKRDMAMIKKIVSELDVVLAQVLIEAIIMEVSLDNGHTTQVSYNQTSPSTPGHYFSGIGAINNGTFLNANNFLSTGSNLVSSVPSGFSYAASFGNDFQATLTAIANDSRITVLSRPRIQTSHGVPASLEVGDTVPEVTGTYFGGINGQASSQYQQTFVGIQLQVTPLINQDGLVVMDIMQDVEQLGTPTTIDGNPVPTTSKRTAQATVSVRDRDTIILGGMISSSKSTTRAGVPFLKDIPGLGYLFRSDSDDFQRKELIVLIRPTVLPTPESAALAATHERNRLPAIKAAEDEEKRDEKKRIKSAEKIPLPDEGY
jgi:general secretion pathway protein D